MATKMSALDKQVYWRYGKTVTLRHHLVFCLGWAALAVLLSIFDGWHGWRPFLSMAVGCMVSVEFQDNPDQKWVPFPWWSAVRLILATFGVWRVLDFAAQW